MKYYTIPPPQSLKQFVRCYRVLDHDLLPTEPQYIYRSIADGCAELVFHYRGLFDDIIGDQQVRGWHSGLHAQSTQHRRFITNQNFGLFGAYIYPFAIPLLLNMPACELSNHTPDLDTLFKAAGRKLEAALDNCSTPKPLGQIAQEYGYYDQSHFIHDVQAFTGYHPGYCFSGLAEGTEYRNI